MISKEISLNKKQIINNFNNTDDLIVYEFKTNSNINMMACYIEGFIDKDLFDMEILKPLILHLKNINDIKNIIFNSRIQEVCCMEKLIDQMPNGRVDLFLEGIDICYTIELSQWEKRA